MTTLKEFQEKINKIQSKVDLKEETHQKNKALLQIIKDMCNETLNEPNLKEEVKNEAKEILKKIESDISLMKGENLEDTKKNSSKNTSSNISIGGYAPAPIKKVLNSVHAGAFDPLSSPILRNLQKKPQFSTKRKEIKPQKPDIKEELKEKNIEPQKKQKEILKEKPKKKKVIEKPLEKKKVKKEPKSDSTPKKPIKKITKKITKKTIKKTAKKTTKKSTKKTVSKKSTPLTSGFLEIEQIQLKIELPFKNSIEMLGRQDFEKDNLEIQIPPEFFSPIIKRDPNSKEAKEHCIIEQIEPQKYFLKDRSNLKKTYFNGVFVDSKGTQLKDGDKFLLPVLVNEQLSSLTVIFHIEK